jgi:hypothetical protein
MHRWGYSQGAIARALKRHPSTISRELRRNHDTDGDGISNFMDLDSDNDGVPDSLEWALGTDPYDPLNPTQVPVHAWPVLVVLLEFGTYVERRFWPQNAQSGTAATKKSKEETV